MSEIEEPKIIRKFGKSLPWLAEVVKTAEIALDLNISDFKTTEGKTNRCSICKGGKFLCGKKSCPLLTRIKSYLKIKPLYNKIPSLSRVYLIFILIVCYDLCGIIHIEKFSSVYVNSSYVVAWWWVYVVVYFHFNNPFYICFETLPNK